MAKLIFWAFVAGILYYYPPQGVALYAVLEWLHIA